MPKVSSTTGITPQKYTFTNWACFSSFESLHTETELRTI